MPITDDSKEKLKNRLVRAMGHLNAVYRMVDEKKYCIDVLHQMKAVQAALNKISEEILKQHLETCVVQAIQNQDTERVVDELIQVFRRSPELAFREPDPSEEAGAKEKIEHGKETGSGKRQDESCNTAVDASTPACRQCR